MRKAIVPVLGFLFLVSPSAAEIDSTVAKSCPGSHEPLVSMAHPNKTYNNIGPPSMYEYKVCVKGLIESRIDTSCSGGPAFYMSSNSTSAHFSMQQGYDLSVCTDNMATELRDTCFAENQTALFRVSEKINGFGRHIAGNTTESPYTKRVCGFFTKPDRVTMELRFNLSSSDDVYFDGEQKGEFTYNSLAEFPYLVSTDGSLVAGIVSTSFLSVERKIDTKNVLIMTKESDKASFFLPFTSGDQDTIEDDQEDILDNSFTNQLSPSFGFFVPEEPTVKAFLNPDVKIDSSLSIGKGTYQIKIKNMGDNEVKITEE